MAKQRSPNYPAISLRDAVEAVRSIHDKEKKTVVSGEVIAKSLGYISLSGNARTKIAALKKYGLLDGDERKGMRVSDLAVRILYPNGATDQMASLREAALRPELFKALYQDFRDGSDAAILHHLINRLDFSPAGAKQVVAAFRDTYSFAGLNMKEYSNTEASDKREAEIVQTEQRAASTAGNPAAGDVMQAVLDGRSLVNVWTWTLSIPRNIKAELKLQGDVTKADLERLKKQIEFLEESFDEESE